MHKTLSQLAFTLAAVTLLAGMFTISGCGVEADASAGRTAMPPEQPLMITDASGEQVSFAGPISRVATLSPTIVELMIELGHPPVLRPAAMGVTPAHWEGIPELALSHQAGPSLEQIAAAAPEAVILPPMFARFAGPIDGIVQGPVFTMDVTCIDTAIEVRQALGDVLGIEEAAQAQAQEIRERIDALAASAPEQAPTVYVLFGAPNSFFCVLPGTYTADLIERAGGELLSAGDSHAMFKGYAPLSLEHLIASDPDQIIVFSHGMNNDRFAQLQSSPAWKNLQAVRTSNVHVLSDELYVLAPGARPVEAFTQISTIVSGADTSTAEVSTR